MADGYGGVVGNWRVHVASWITQTQAGQCLVHTESRFQAMNGWHYAGLNGAGAASVAGENVTNSASITVGTNGEQTVCAKDRWIARTHNTQNVECTGNVSVSGYAAGWSGASAWVSIPARASSTISFDANGGSGAPSPVTKWVGEQLTIPNQKPTRANYTFLGWSTSRDNTAEYQPSGSYWSADGNATYYAVWKLNSRPPVIAGFDVYRCNENGTPRNDGTYVKMTCNVTIDKSADSSNLVSTLKFAWKDASGWHDYGATATNSTNSTFSSIFKGYDNDKSWDLRVTVTDKHSTTFAYTTIGPASYILDLTADGRGIGIGQAAPKQGVAIYGSPLTLNGVAWDSVTLCDIEGWHIYTYGKVVSITANNFSLGTGAWDTITCPYRLPAQYRPPYEINNAAITTNGVADRRIYVQTDGYIKISNIGGNVSTQPAFASITYVAG